MSLTPQQESIVICAGNWAGPNYSGSMKLDGNPILPTYAAQVTHIWTAYHSSDPRYAPTGFIDAAAKEHDLGYWYAEDNFRSGLQQTFGVTSKDNLTAEQKASTEYKQLEAQLDSQYFDADVALLKNALAWKPTDPISATYRELLLDGFYLKATAYGKSKELMDLHWNELHAIDPNYLPPGIPGVISGLAIANAWRYTEMQALLTSGLSPQEIGLFNQHLTRATGLDTGHGGDLLVRPEKDDLGNFVKDVQIDGKRYHLELDSYSHVFTRSEVDADGNLLGTETWSPDETKPSDYNNRAYTYIKRDADGTMLESRAVPADVVPATLALQANHDSIVGWLNSQADRASKGLLEDGPPIVQAKPVPIVVSDLGGPESDVITVRGTNAAGTAGQTTEIRFNDNGPAIVTVRDENGVVVGRGTFERFEDGSTLQSVTYSDGHTIKVSTDSDGSYANRTDVVPTATGSISTTRFYTLGTTVRLDVDKSGNILERTETVYAPNGPAAVTVFDGSSNVVGRGTLDTFEDGSTRETINYSDGRIIRTNADGDGKITSRANIQITDDGSVETVVYADGHAVKLIFDKDRNLLSQEPIETGAQTLSNAINQYGSTVIDALTIIKAIQSGDPLPIVASGLRLANDIQTLNGAADYNLAGAANVATGVLSILRLENALQRGDTLATVTAGAQALKWGAQTYADFAVAEGLKTDSAELLASGFDAAALSQAIGKALPFLDLANSIANGDEVGTAIAAVEVANAMEWIEVPVIGEIAVAYAIFNLVSSLFGGDDDPPPEPWGNAWAEWSGYTTVVNATGNDGAGTVRSTYQNFVTYLDELASYEQAVNPGSAIGVIANRLPNLSYRNYSGFQLTDIDPITGIQRYPEIKYDLTGHPYNAPAGSEQASQSLSDRFIQVALERGAVAPMWEVQTAAIQTQYGDPKAGLTEEERAGRNGMLAAPVTGAEQTWRPVILDLDGDGVQTTGANKSVAFDVDDSGFLKSTAWAENSDGFLFLDRNLNGQIDSAKELFSNSTVALGVRGLAGMQWVDSNYDGRLTTADPVWNELKVWQDANGDGQVETGEVKTLASLGITALDYSQGRYGHNGQMNQMSSPDLVADTEGTRTHVVPEGIIVQTSSGHTSLLVTRLDDKSVIEANRDGFTSYEDTEAIVSSADLLANDLLGGFSGANLALTGVSNFTNGSGWLDGNGFVHFNPTANYYGPTSFAYTVQAPTGQTSTGTVDINLQNLNDAPTAAVDQHLRPIYGYASAYSNTDEYGNTTLTPTDPQFAPYTGYDYSLAYYWQTYGYHNTIESYQDSDGPNIGNIIANDIDDPSGPFTYQVVSAPQYGDVQLDANGGFHYFSWSSPGVRSNKDIGPTDANATYGTSGPPADVVDPFVVRVTDPHGASTDVRVNSVHTGAYNPSTGGGGGGGGGCCPISIDMDRNGFGFSNVDDSNVFFDINGDGWKEKLSWIAPGDGLLAYDADGDGKIESGAEISFAAYSKTAQSDLEGLRAFDTNGDGKLSAADEKWSKFGIWQDANQNGITDPGEFKSLDELGVAVVDLTSDRQFSVIDGTTVQGFSKVTMTDGSTRDVADFILRYTNQVLVGNADGSGQVVTNSPFSPSGEVLDGTSGDDLILGKTGNNVVNGYDGNDVVMEDGGNDFIDGGGGNDTIYSGADNDIVVGGTGDDLVFAGLGNDMVFGGDGHDALVGEQGNDVIFGGNGNDLISGGAGNDVLSGDAGDDQIYGEAGNDALFGRDGNDELAGMDGYDRLDGGAGNDLLDGGAAADTMIGGAGDDVYVVDDVGDTVTEETGGGNDTVRSTIGYALGANVENLALAGNAALTATGNGLDNVLTGNAGNSTLIGGAGNDTLIAGLGVTTMIGDSGNDTFVVNKAADVVQAQAGGNHTIKTSVSYTASANVATLIGMGSADITLTGNDLANTIVANSGDSTLVAGSGAATMIGGAGDNTFVVNRSDDAVSEQPNAGMDTVLSSVDYVAPENVEILQLTGTADLTATGNEQDNILICNAGADMLAGGGGNDTLIAGSGVATMIGGAGNDTFVVNRADDVVIEEANGGNDTIRTSVSYTASADVENLTGTGSADLTLTGNDLANVITSNAGNTTLIAGSGVATMIGGAGDNTFVVNNTADVVIEQPNAGNDTILTSVSYTAAANVENLVGTGSADIILTGNDIANTIVSNCGNTTLIAGSGVATMIGGAGDNIFVVNSAADVVIEQPNAGNDTIMTSVSYTASANVENLTGIGGAGNNTLVINKAEDTVTEQANAGIDTIVTSVSYVLPENVENLIGVGNADLTLVGNDLQNTLVANGGNTTLVAGSGVATMIGGIGNNTFVVNNVADVVTEQSNAGDDTILTSVSYTAAANVENLTGTGSADITLTGNDLANVITSNAGNTTLVAGSGVATMIGGIGDNTFVVNNTADIVIEQPGAGLDTIMSSVSYTASANVENLTGIGSADITLTGNNLASVITANSGNTTLVAGSGVATMIGGIGDNTFIVNKAADTVTEQPNAGIDTILTSVSYVLPENVENLTGTGSADLTLTGNDLTNVITSNDGNTTLVAGSGVATMIGGVGDNTFVVNNTADVVVEQPNAGSDTILTSVSYTAAANVENLTGTGGADIVLTGNDLANVITANAGNTTLVAGIGVATMIGGTGNNTFVVNNVADVIIEQPNAGIDTIMTSVSYTTPNNVENLIGTGGAAITLTGNSLDNTIVANAGNDILIGGGGNDTFVSGTGNDTMFGGVGNDTYVYALGNGLDTVIDTGGKNTARFGSGLSLQNVVVRLTAPDGTPYTVDADSSGYSAWWSIWGPPGRNQPVTMTAHLRVLDANGVEQGGQGMDFSVTMDRYGNFTSPIQTFQFADGSTNSFYDMLVKEDVVDGRCGSGAIVTRRNDDTVYAGCRTTAVYLGSGNDTVYASPVGTLVYGGGGTDYMIGSSGNDTFIGGYGVSIMQGWGGSDTLTDTKGKAAMFGGSGNDILTGGGGNDFFASGTGTDVISTGATQSVVAFNAGGGKDTVLASPGGANTLSLGGGIDYRNLSFNKSGNDLVLNTGGCDSITFKDWYASSANHDFVTLQVIEEASWSYNKHSSDPLCNQKVEQFDFARLVDRFDAARSADPKLNSWNLMNGLLSAHLSGSDSAAIGGDLAYQFGSRGSLSGIDLSAIQATLTDPQFGKAPQATHSWNTVSQSCKTLC